MAMILTADKTSLLLGSRSHQSNGIARNWSKLAVRLLALLGFGSIGRLVAERALAFGMQVKVLARRPRNEWPEGVKAVSDLTALLSDADHVVLAAPATAATYILLIRRR